MHLWQESHRKGAEICRVVQNFSSGDVHSDRLIKAVLARILHCKVTLFPIVVNKYFVGKYVKTI